MHEYTYSDPSPKVSGPQFAPSYTAVRRTIAGTVPTGIRQQRNKGSAPVPLKTLGMCLECHDGTPADPATYIAPPAKHLLAA